MSLNRYAQIYYDALLQLDNQKSTLFAAQKSLDDYKNSDVPPSLERNLKLTALADKLHYEQHVYDEYSQNFGDSAIDIIEELTARQAKIDEKIDIELHGNRYIQFYLESETKVNHLGPFSRA